MKISFHAGAALALLAVLSADVQAESRMQVSAGSTPIRVQPAADAPTVGRATAGEILFVARVEGDWAAISPPDRIDLWLNKDFIEGNRVVAKSIQLRAGPGVQHPVVGVLERGAPVMPRGEEGDWCRIAAPSAATLWVKKSDLSEVRAQAAPIQQVAPVPEPAKPAPAPTVEAPPPAPPAPKPEPVAQPVATAAPAPAPMPTPTPAPAPQSPPRIAPSKPHATATPASKPPVAPAPAPKPPAPAAAPARPVSTPAPAVMPTPVARPAPAPRPPAVPALRPATALPGQTPPAVAATAPAKPAPAKRPAAPAASAPVAPSAPAAPAAQPKPRQTEVEVDPALVEELDLEEMPNQGKTVQVEGELRNAPFMAGSPSRYRLQARDEDGVLEMVCHVHGDSARLRPYVGQTIAIRGREYWVVDSDMPVVVVGQIESLAPPPADEDEPVMF